MIDRSVRIRRLPALAVASLLIGLTGVAQAQSDEPETEPAETEATDAEAIDPDNSADDLNARQQLRQSFTLERRINGELVDRDERSIEYNASDPLRATEAGQSPFEALRAAFDQEALTRNEAFEEAKLNFTVADVDRDGIMTRDEFVRLTEVWRRNDFVNRLGDVGMGAVPGDYPATEKFAFMAGALATLSRADYVREVLLEFDAADADRNGVLEGEDLLRFRAANRGLDASDPLSMDGPLATDELVSP